MVGLEGVSVKEREQRKKGGSQAKKRVNFFVYTIPTHHIYSESTAASAYEQRGWETISSWRQVADFRIMGEKETHQCDDEEKERKRPGIVVVEKIWKIENFSSQLIFLLLFFAETLCYESQ